MRKFASELQNIFYSSRFTGFIRGVDLRLPTGESISVRVEKTERSVRPIGLRFSPFAFITEVRAGENFAFGYGESDSKLLALQKSISEGVERCVFKSLYGTEFGSQNSNGWAAHLNHKLANESALNELLERDAVLVHWLSKKEFIEVSESTWPEWLVKWTQGELSLGEVYKTLRIFISTEGFIPTVTTVLVDKHGHSVSSHAAAPTISEAVTKALIETCRIAQIAIDGEFKESSRSLIPGDSTTHSRVFPEDHAMLYAHHEKLPKWIFGKVETWSAASLKWAQHFKRFDIKAANSVYHPLVTGPLVVGRCTSDSVQNLYFGSLVTAEKEGRINLSRFGKVMRGKEFNPMPHWVA